MKKSCIGLAVSFLWLVAFLPWQTLAGGVENGEKAPDFTLPAVDGSEHSLSDYEGKFVILEWVNYDCPFVRKHYRPGNMQDLQKTYAEKGAVWLSICSSAPGKQGHFTIEEWERRIADQNVQATAVLLDPEGNVGRMYDAKVTPHMYIINPEGILIYQGAIDSIRSANPDDIEKAVPYVRRVMDAALAGEPIPEPTQTTAYGCTVKY